MCKNLAVDLLTQLFELFKPFSKKILVCENIDVDLLTQLFNLFCYRRCLKIAVDSLTQLFQLFLIEVNQALNSLVGLKI